MNLSQIKNKFIDLSVNIYSTSCRKIISFYYYLISQDSGLLFAFFIVLLMWALNVNSIPWMDSAAEIATKELHFYNGDLRAYLFQNPMDHPLGRILTLTLFLKIFGLYAFATTLPGMLLNLAAVLSIFSLAQKYGNINCARISAILLACDSVFIATSVHTLPDHFFSAFALVAAYAYAANRMRLWALALTAAVLTKETALLLVFAFIGQWIIAIPFKLKSHHRLNYVRLLIPVFTLVIYGAYWKIAGFFGLSPWTFDGHSGFYTAWQNLLNISDRLDRMYNGNFFEHLNLLLLTVFNFQWILNGLAYWWFILLVFDAIKSINPVAKTTLMKIALTITTIVTFTILIYAVYFLFQWQEYIVFIATFFILPTAFFLSVFIIDKISKMKPEYFDSPFFAIVLFSIAYICLGLTYNTWSNPRYVLPITVFIITPAAFFIDFLVIRVGRNTRYFLYASGFLIMAIRFFTSADPITNQITVGPIHAYDKVLIKGQVVYQSNLQGLDSVVYNNQYLQIIANTTTKFHEYAKLDRESVSQTIDCDDIALCCEAVPMLVTFTNFDRNNVGLCHRK